MLIRIQSRSELQAYEAKIKEAAERTMRDFASREETGMQLLHLLKFAKIGRHPIQERDLNFIEQVNQTFTYLVSLRAVHLLFDIHPDIDGFLLNLGTRAGSDIENLDRRVIAAEVFAAVKPSNNRKLSKDVHKVIRSPAKHKYVFFHAPGFSVGRQVNLERHPEVQVWAVDL